MSELTMNKSITRLQYQTLHLTYKLWDRKLERRCLLSDGVPVTEVEVVVLAGAPVVRGLWAPAEEGRVLAMMMMIIARECNPKKER